MSVLVVSAALVDSPRAQSPPVQQAYLKPLASDDGDTFGKALAMSGNTVVVGVPQEDSRAKGVGGTPYDNDAKDSGAAWVFVRNGSKWTLQAYLKASNTQTGDEFGTAVAISGDTIVVGAPYEDSSATGVDGDQDNDLLATSGAAYVFHRDGTTWSQQAYLKPATSNYESRFGSSVAIDGDTIVVGMPRELSSATGVNGDPSVGTAFSSGAAHVYVRQGGTWTWQAYLKASNTDAYDLFGQAVSACGNTIVVCAPNEDGSSSGVDGDQLNNDAPDAGAAYVFVRQGDTWSQQAYLKASNTGPDDAFGGSVAMSGERIVVGAPRDDSNATGVDGDATNEDAPVAGAAHTYVRSNGAWSHEAYLKASNAETPDQFGWAVAQHGDTIVVGAYSELSKATGIDGDQANNDFVSAGAAYVFQLEDDVWSQLAYVKASNTDPDDRFGFAVAATGGAFVVGAYTEDSIAIHINGNQLDNGLSAAGAAYTFALDPWTTFGGGTAGTTGPLHMSMTGSLLPGSSLTLNLSDAPPSSLAAVLVALQSQPAPVFGGTLYATPTNLLAFMTTDASGELHGTASFPGASSGQELWFQVAVKDSSLPGNVLGPAVQGVVP